MANVLIADDDKMIAELLRQMLQAEGHSVTIVDDGDRAVQMFSVRSFDVCILDVVMRRKSGLDAAEEIHARHPDCPIILMSGIANVRSAEILERIGRIGILHSLAKPFTRVQVIAAINDSIGKEGKEGKEGSAG